MDRQDLRLDTHADRRLSKPSPTQKKGRLARAGLFIAKTWGDYFDGAGAGTNLPAFAVGVASAARSPKAY
jgi:hypothetical protein